MTGEVTIEAESDVGPLETLSELIQKRQEYLKGETTENAVIATAINVVSSLKADTTKAPLTGTDDMHVTVTEVEGGAGWRGGRGNRRRTAIGADGHRIRGVRPVNLMYGLTGSGSYYKITLVNPKLEPRQSLNAPYYYVLAPNLETAKKFARERVTHALQKESGMAKYALGIAQAKVSDRPMNADQPSGSNAMRTAYDAAQINKSFGDGTFGIHVLDSLNYATGALKSGDGALTAALEKAANKTAAIINKLAGYRLDEPIPTPFPRDQE